MTLSSLGKRYAEALADVVTSPGSAVRADAAVAELHSFDAVLKGSAELHNALTSPAVPPARKRAVVERITAQMNLSRIVRNFLFVLIDHRRIALVSDIIQAFEVIVDERLGFARAEITSAAELNESQRASLTAQLERMTGRKLRMRYAVDQSLIGGVVAQIGSTVYDGSVRGQLHSIGRRLGAEG